MGQVNTHNFVDVDQLKGSVLPRQPGRDQAPSRQPHYAVEQNKVLPFEFPQKALRPASAELKHRYPEYRNIYENGARKSAADVNKHPPGNDVKKTSADMGVSESKDLTKTNVDNTGYVTTDLLTNNGIIPNGYKHFNSNYNNLHNPREQRNLNFYQKHVVGVNKPGVKACLVDNGQIINLPQKSSFDMDYSFAVTYAQLAKHRRHQNLQKIKDKEAEFFRKENTQFPTVVDEKINEATDTKVKYRAPPPPLKSGVEPPVDYDVSDDSEASDIPHAPTDTHPDTNTPKHENEQISQARDPDYEDGTDSKPNSPESARKGIDDSFVVVDKTDCIIEQIHSSPNSDTKRLSSLLQHDIVNAALVRQAKLKRKAQRIPAPRTAQDVCQTELAKICREREKRTSVAMNKTSNNKIPKEEERDVVMSNTSLEHIDHQVDEEQTKDFEIILYGDLNSEKVENKTFKEEEMYLSDVTIKYTDEKNESKIVTEKDTVDANDSFDDEYIADKAKLGDSGIQASRFPKDWTPEHDLDESDDDRKSVLTNTRNGITEGFKTHVIPSQGMGNTVNLKAPKADKRNQFTSLLKFSKSSNEKTDKDKSDLKVKKGLNDKITDTDVRKKSDTGSCEDAGVVQSGAYTSDQNGQHKNEKVKPVVDKKKEQKHQTKSAGNNIKKKESPSMSCDSKSRSNTSFSSESIEVTDDNANAKNKNIKTKKTHEISTIENATVDKLKTEDGGQKINKRIKKMKKFGYLGTAKMKEKKRLQLYLQDQRVQQERKIESERRKQKEIEKQIRRLDVHDASSENDDDDDDNDDDESDNDHDIDDNIKEKVHKNKKETFQAGTAHIPVQYMAPLAYQLPAVIQPQVSINPTASSNPIMSPGYSGWFGNPPSLVTPASFNLPFVANVNPSMQLSQLSQLSPGQQPMPHDFVQYMRMLEQTQQMMKWPNFHNFPQNYPGFDPHTASMYQWMSTNQENTETNANINNSSANGNQSTTQLSAGARVKTTTNPNGPANNSNVMIDDALLSAMMNDYKKISGSSKKGKARREERANPLYDSSENEDDQVVVKQHGVDKHKEKASLTSSVLPNHNVNVYGPMGYRPVNFLPNENTRVTKDHNNHSD